LGDLGNEIHEDLEWIEFASSGKKCYGAKMRRKGAPEGEYEYLLKVGLPIKILIFYRKSIIQVKGITLSVDVAENQGLCYEQFKKRIFQYVDQKGKADPITVTYPRFLKPDFRAGTVHSVRRCKQFRPLITSGYVTPDFLVHEFGDITS
jgi:hypothetical protein